MPRALTMRRAAVPADRVPAYLAAIGRAAGRRAAAQQHFWLFRHRDRPGIFLEFREGPDRAALAPAADEAELERLADYSAGGAEVWLEVPLSTH